MTEPQTNFIYHLTSKNAWQDAQHKGLYRHSSLQEEGFIHASTWQQVTMVANNFYRDVADLVLLVIDSNCLSAVVKWEAPVHPDGEEHVEIDAQTMTFPHIYGSVDIDAVRAVLAMPRDAQGDYALPELPDLD